MLKTFLEQWLEDVHKPTIRISTLYRYRGILDNHILPELGHIQLQRLTAQQVQALYAKKTREGLAPSSIVKIHQILHMALDSAVRWRLVSRNVCDDVSPPSREKHEIQPLTKEQAQRLLQVARGHRLEALLTLALATGMRRGEMLGLRWSDIDLVRGSLQVRRSMNRVGKNGVVESGPKTAKGRRSIVLPQFVIEVLKQHRIRQVEARLKAGEQWEDHDWVFCNIYGRFLEPVIVHRLFKKLLADARLPQIRFHDLRHSAATFLLGMGYIPKWYRSFLDIVKSA
jgi:integrase